MRVIVTCAVVVVAAHCACAQDLGATLSLSTFRDKLRGGWAGQMVGVSYGAPYEFHAQGSTYDGPIREWEPGHVWNSIHQDDLYVEMTFLGVLDRYGPGATHEQAGIAFRDSEYRLWHANRAARENLRQGIMPPDSGHPRYNPHADDIDFQIEADVFGLVCPRLPASAGALCDVFGSVMNYGDGLYGGRFIAAMYSQAYAETEAGPESVRRCLDAGLRAIPAASHYAEAIRDVIQGFERHLEDWRGTWAEIEPRWGAGDLCPVGRDREFNIDAKLNGAYVAIGLLYGRGDFATTLEVTTRCGQDADCNPASAAGVLGTILGYRQIPERYTSVVPELTGHPFEFTDYDFPSLLEVCERVARRVVVEAGGRIVNDAGDEAFEIPVQRPVPPAELQQMRFFPREDLAAWAEDFERRARRAFVERFPIARWSEGWRVVAMGTEMDPGVRTVMGRERVLVTHPVRRDEPAAIEKPVKVPAGRPRLLLEVTSFPENGAGDWLLRVLVDGELLGESVVDSKGVWERIELDLSKWRGREVTLRLENAAGGHRDWAWEAGYWAAVEVVGGR